MADTKGMWLAGAAVLIVGAVWLGTSAQGKAKAAAQLRLAADHGRVQAGVMGSGSIRTGVTPQTWVPYCPPGAHRGAHRMYRHPKNSSPNFSRMTTAPNAYDWVFSPPSEVDL